MPQAGEVLFADTMHSFSQALPDRCINLPQQQQEEVPPSEAECKLLYAPPGHTRR